MRTAITRCPFDTDIPQMKKYGVKLWSKLIVTIDDRICHPDEFCGAVGSRDPNNPMQGYVIYLGSPVSFRPYNGKNVEYKKTSQEHGIVVIHNPQEESAKYPNGAGITHCGGCMSQLQTSDWWDRSTYIASSMQNGKSMVAARQYTRDEMNAHDMEREKVGAAYLAGR